MALKAGVTSKARKYIWKWMVKKFLKFQQAKKPKCNLNWILHYACDYNTTLGNMHVYRTHMYNMQAEAK